MVTQKTFEKKKKKECSYAGSKETSQFRMLLRRQKNSNQNVPTPPEKRQSECAYTPGFE